MKKLLRRRKIKKWKKLIEKSGLFDEKYYLFTYPDVRSKDIDPIMHYIKYGSYEGRNPNAEFNTLYYIKNNPDVTQSSLNPFAHYILFGKDENRQTTLEFKSTNRIKTAIQCYSQLKDYYNSIKKSVHIDNEPFISIIILNKDGIEHLERLFNSINKYTTYKNFELIIVDNNSLDQSKTYLKKNQYNFNLRVIENSQNVSFSKGNNQAALIAKGDYFLLLNNDVEVTKNWLCTLMQKMLSSDKIGSVGAKLIYPYKDKFKNSCTVQHAGIAFKYEDNFIRPYNLGYGKSPQNNYNNDSNHAAVTAACLLISRKCYEEVGGLDEDYFYGYEDVDLGLKLASKGYKNILSSSSVLFHYEFGTQNNDTNDAIRKRRLNNMHVFQKKWKNYIAKKYWYEKFNFQEGIFTESKLTIAIAVTDAGKNISEGDYFTALELAQELKKFNFKIIFLRRKYNEWYSFTDEVDVLIALLDAYDLHKLPKFPKKVISIAWARNWFDRWVKNNSFNDYDFVYASSQIACNYIKEHTTQTATLLPIATNISKFNLNNIDKKIKKYQCDYCFTGSYWQHEREIITFIDPSRLQKFKFHIYGKNWEQVKKLKDYNCGFLAYDQMPLVYANTKIVIDDANHVTKPYGSVNSRVFDALAAGALVITNGTLGSKLTFDGELPYFTTQDELYEQLSYYLNNDRARKNKINQLRNIILNEHTYAHRAHSIKNLLNHFYLKTSIAIKIPAPDWKVVEEWGDYHFALALQKEFQKLGYRVILQVLSEWDNNEGNQCDVALVLRGLSKYTIKPYQFNIMWNISHPAKVSIDEYNEYDYVFIASTIWAEEIAHKISVPVEALLQCTDSDLFNNEKDENIDYSLHHELLFVGNSRKVYRKVIKDLLPTDYKLSIYGNHWNELVDNKLIKGIHIPNKKLSKYYRSADILLNDHWDDMRIKGFISNRIFDALASGAFIISDEVAGIQNIFQDTVVTYKNKDDLKTKINYYLSNPKERTRKIKEGMRLVHQNHTFKSRAKYISNIIEEQVFFRNHN